jgi:hypothetical protein
VLATSTQWRSLVQIQPRLLTITPVAQRQRRLAYTQVIRRFESCREYRDFDVEQTFLFANSDGDRNGKQECLPHVTIAVLGVVNRV